VVEIERLFMMVPDLIVCNWSIVCINWVSRKKWIWENRHWSCGHANG